MRFIKILIILLVLIISLFALKVLYGFEIPANQILYKVELNNNIVHITAFDTNSAFVSTNYRINYAKNDKVYITLYHTMFCPVPNTKEQFEFNINQSGKTKIYFKGKGHIRQIYGIGSQPDGEFHLYE